MDKRIAFIQPALPKYRVGFFDNVGRYAHVKIFCNLQDFNQVRSVETSLNVEYGGGFAVLPVLKGLYWHNKLPIIRILKDFDVVVVNKNLRVLNYVALIIVSFFFSTKVIAWGHLTSGKRERKANMIANILLSGFVNSLLFYTDEEVKRFKKFAPRVTNVSAMSNGLDYKCIERLRMPIERKKSDQLTILFIGRVTEKSKYSLLIEALKLINDFSVSVHVIGNENAVTLSIGSHMVFLHGPIDEESHIAEIANKCDVFCYPGNVGLSLIHAFSYGLPAVIHGNRIHHMPEGAAFIDGFNGLSFTENDAISLVEALTRYASLGTNERKVMSKNAVSIAAGTYNIDQMSLRFERLISSL